MEKKFEKVRTVVQELWSQLVQTEMEMEMQLKMEMVKKSHYYWI
jgi:hypothetical protein